MNSMQALLCRFTKFVWKIDDMISRGPSFNYCLLLCTSSLFNDNQFAPTLYFFFFSFLPSPLFLFFLLFFFFLFSFISIEQLLHVHDHDVVGNSLLSSVLIIIYSLCVIDSDPFFLVNFYLWREQETKLTRSYS